MNKKKRLSLGPAVLVTAAFIGPGTVLTASKAGSEFGFILLWAVAFSVVATIVLQEMAARMGIITGAGLSQAIKTSFPHPLARMSLLGLVLVAILIGNAAYQTGNILGAASGVKAVADPSIVPVAIRDKQAADEEIDNLFVNSIRFQNGLVVLIAIFALGVIWIGRFDLLQNLLSMLVALMSMLFIYAAVRSGPVLQEVVMGFVPRIPSGGEWIVIGIIGTTVVPYNLFLHASAAAQQWEIDPADSDSDSKYRRAIIQSRWDTIMSVVVGGLVTCAILVTASVAFHHSGPGNNETAIHNQNIAPHDVALQLEPVLGRSSKLVFSIGLFAAGLTSAITAPIAAGFAVSGCFGWPGRLKDWRLKVTATAVMLAGVMFAVLFGKSPQQTIILAQVANGLLLPIVAILLLVIANRTNLMNQYKNRRLTNVLGVFVVLVATLIAVRQFNSVSQKVYKMINSGNEVSCLECKSGIQRFPNCANDVH